MIEDRSIALPSDQTTSVPLEEKTVSVRQLTDNLVSVPDPVTGDEMLVKDEVVKSTVLRPVVDIANFGKMDIIRGKSK